MSVKFGVGTSLTFADAPAPDCAYKLQEYARRVRRERSSGYRRALDERTPGESLLQPVT